MENGHRNSWFTHQKWWFSIVMLVCLPEGSNELGLFERSLAPQSLIWLVVDLLLWKIGESQLGLWHSQLNGKIKNVPNHQPVIDDNADALFLRMIVFNWAYISYLVGSNQNNPGNPILLWTSTSNVDLSEYYPKWSIILYRLEIATNGCCWSKFQIHPFDIAHYTCIYIYILIFIMHIHASPLHCDPPTKITHTLRQSNAAMRILPKQNRSFWWKHHLYLDVHPTSYVVYNL